MKRSGRSTAGLSSGGLSGLGGGAAAAALLGRPATFSREKSAMNCGLALLQIWKSSCLKLPTALSWRSRTTTGTITRLTRALNIAGSSWVAISAGGLAGACGGGGGGFGGGGRQGRRGLRRGRRGLRRSSAGCEDGQRQNAVAGPFHSWLIGSQSS